VHSPEARLIRERSMPVLWGYQLDQAEALFPAMLKALPEKIYLTFDIDYLWEREGRRQGA